MAKKKTSPKTAAKPKRKGGKQSPLDASRRMARLAVCGGAALLAALCVFGCWFVHHPAEWLERHEGVFTAPLAYFGERTAFVSDALGVTGHDSVYDSDDPPPQNSVFFAGTPVRTAAPAPDDVRVLKRGETAIGWSPSLGHPVWAACRIPQAARFDLGKLPKFQKDASVDKSPSPSDYAKSPYRRASLLPVNAIATRFGPDELKKAFRMTAAAPMPAALQVGPWNEIQQRLADFWPQRYGELWVVTGAVPSAEGRKIAGTAIDVPDAFFIVVAAQAADGVRALALLVPQDAGRWDYLSRYLLTVDELEAKTGLDFFPEMPKYLQRPLEADRATRLWPVRAGDVLKLILARFSGRSS